MSRFPVLHSLSALRVVVFLNTENSHLIISAYRVRHHCFNLKFLFPNKTTEMYWFYDKFFKDGKSFEKVQRSPFNRSIELA